MKLKGWEEDKKRWVRMHGGKRYRRTCRQMGLPPEDWTAERSYPAFRAWFNRQVMLADMPPMDDEIREAIKPILDWLAEESWKDDVKEFEATGEVPDVRFVPVEPWLAEEAWQKAVNEFEETGKVPEGVLPQQVGNLEAAEFKLLQALAKKRSQDA